ncbi:ubiquitin thioesterase protein OTUB1 [Angomonas deanei]|nr:ubiquitin thioesterase protein OTUB1 [Angomonas deanei]|eukprot:EPY25374.1 ubiquitin thioesterase protein OTUB1 [Angomonas deanei]
MDENELIEKQLREIRNEVEQQPLISTSDVLSDTCKLVQDFKDNEAFFRKVQTLVHHRTSIQYKAIRYIRRDGNCFYRGATFQLFSLALQYPEFAAEVKRIFASYRDTLLRVFGEYVDDFYSVTCDIVDHIISKKVDSVGSLLDEITSTDNQGYLIVFMRYMVSLYIREHKDEYLPFIMGMDYETVEAYCVAEVEALDHVSDNLQLAALAALFQVQIQIETIDPSPTDSTCPLLLNESVSDNSKKYTLYFLFTPGHYDVLQV